MTAPASTTSGSVSATKPWWKQPFVTVLVILALLGAGLWFGFEMRVTTRRRNDWRRSMVKYGIPPGWVPA